MDIKDMAWRFADKLCPRLPAEDREMVFTALGSGDAWRAIALMLIAARRANSPLPDGMASELDAWLNRYRGSLDEQPVRELLDQMRQHPELFDTL